MIFACDSVAAPGGARGSHASRSGNTLSAGFMQAAGVTRFFGISAIPVAPESIKSAFERRMLHPLLYRFFGGGYADMARMEQLLAGSAINWTVFRASRLTNGPQTGRYRTAVNSRLPRASSVSRADLAEAMLAAVGDTALYRHAVAIAK